MVAVGFGLALAILASIGVASCRNTTALIETARRVAHSHEVLAKLKLVFSLVTDAETSRRGYIITGHEQQLEPYQAAVRSLGPELDNLRKLTADNPRQQQWLEGLGP